jgi:hypothetical protein
MLEFPIFQGNYDASEETLFLDPKTLALSASPPES